MDVHINNKDLKTLYVTGNSKKLKLRADIIDKFFAVIQKIQAAENIYDLWNNPALSFKKYKDHYSIRLSGQYRLETEVKWLNDKKTVGEFHLIEI